ncbi:hypothetical protein LAWI1_G006540 [Lachnellula willkommii]|uniref:Uncharacterized protein n=1 Tax=Lachnellula willkommii TaxID=215461 RepID=A0A559M5Q9_9HELO|nr:hypothetical protein LAWI1_G006540 [Lachnellula willkommii]
MKGLDTFRNERAYENTERRGFWSSILCDPKGLPKSTSTAQYRDEKEKKYHHTPTHAASSFLKTATTPAMIPAIQAQGKQKKEQSIPGPAEGEISDAHQSQSSA